MGFDNTAYHYNLSIEEDIVNHEITVQLELDDLNCSLLRLISSYIMNTANFTIDEMDEFKFLLHEILTYVKKNLSLAKPVQINFFSAENSIQTKITIETIPNEHTYSINQTNALYQIAKHLLKDFTFDESQDQKLIFTLKKEKRAIHG